MDCSTIMAVCLDNRVEDAPRFQELITQYGCIIKTRLGLHEVENCSRKGLIILQLCGDDEEVNKLGEEINSLASARARWMKLEF